MTTAHATAEPVITESAKNESLKELDVFFDEIDKLEKVRNHANPSSATSIPKITLSIPPGGGSVVGRICICYGA